MSENPTPAELSEEAEPGVTQKWISRVLSILTLAGTALVRVQTGVWGFIRAIPVFVSLGKEVFGFLHEVRDHFERVERLKKLKDALVAGRRNDPAPMTDLFGGQHGSTPLPPTPSQSEPGA